MAVGDYTIPRANAPFSEGGGNPTREWYNYLRFVGAANSTSNAELLNDITIISDKLGSPDGTPENIPAQGSSGIISGLDSVAVQGILPHVVQINLVGDIQSPGNTYYYGTDTTGAKSFYTVASAFLGTTGNIVLTVDVGGVTTINLAAVADSGTGSLLAITKDGFGRVTGTKSATITGTANRVTVSNGDAVSGLPTIDISAAYVGQTSITTVGTITTGTWSATAIAANHGGTGQTVYAIGDILYASGTGALSKLPIGTTGQVLTVASGLPSWSAGGGGGGVTSFNGRTGAVVPQSGDYTFAMIGSTPTTLAGYGITDAQAAATRTTTTVSSPTGVQVLGTVVMAKTSRLLGLSSNNPLRLRLYTTVALRNADVSRLASAYPPPGAGLLFEGVTTAGLLSFDCGPTTDIFNNEAIVTNAIAYTLQPASAVSTTATLNFMVIQP